MELGRAVERYLEVAQAFGRPMPLRDFGVSREELELAFSAWEEDYQIHRHFELLPADGNAGETASPSYEINGQLYTAIIIKETIRDVFS
ncbi:MAG: hypothetical protein HYX72_12495 [Acidobacteria bacterium]|nr:hypothetical protein [Acidobacteriota bacterium]